MHLHVLYENEDWMPPLREALRARELPVVEHFTAGGTLDLGGTPAPGVYLNRMSPSSHTRGHQGGVVLVRDWLDHLERRGLRVLNGSRAFALEVSKVRQDSALRSHGILTPRTLAVVEGDLVAAARSLGAPLITKDNQGGKGMGVRLFADLAAFEQAVAAGEIAPGPDGVVLLQQYIAPREPHITRVEIAGGRFLYALRASTAAGFELCPADACQVGDAFCPVGEGADDGRFTLSELTAADPLVRSYLAFAAAEGLDIAGIEFVEDAAGRRYTYDINGTTNYNGDLERRHGLDGMGAIAALAADALEEALDLGRVHAA